MSLVEYVSYLRLEIKELRHQLANAIAREKLYEPLLRDVSEEEYPPPVMPAQTSFFDWIRQKLS